jgi:hypothetical protein
MAVVYTLEGNDPVTIGGGTSSPFPRYSIERTPISTGDGIGLNNTYTITVTGTILPDSSADITDDGNMQSSLQEKVIEKLQINVDVGSNVGRLEISPYGGKANHIEFLDARLTSIQFPEQSDTALGVTSTDYVFTFVANEDISNSLSTAVPYNLRSATETWNVQIHDDIINLHPANYSALSGEPDKTYTITHTISASANKKYTTGPSFSRSGWKEAAEWVKTRLLDAPSVPTTNDAIDDANFSTFYGYFFDTAGSTLGPNLSTLSFFNHTRTPEIDLFEGSYTVTETWTASKYSHTIDYTVEVAQDEQEVMTITFSGTVQGLDNKDVNSLSHNKYDNATAMKTFVNNNAYSISNSFYDGTGTLSNVPITKTMSHNKGLGTLTFSFSYNDFPVLLDNAISTSLKITDDNEDHPTKIIAIVPIIAKSSGPIIQDMLTSKEQRRIVQLDAVMRRTNRTVKPSQGKTVALSYVPDGTTKLVTHTENWEPNTGIYSINLEWVY